ncbi:hypothetical protein FBZ96_106526 [Bradyrhizobium stylosanthis]|uniref:Uncharacterized protein n=1 Tax=Bradyrhizobium stylosanthis TaxID=1803665 RepID=A0A560DK31_9BRAD|nr:hypothetical protein FBZ96_106526 [Bradyrhizobium stylosanthis]
MARPTRAGLMQLKGGRYTAGGLRSVKVVRWCQ